MRWAEYLACDLNADDERFISVGNSEGNIPLFIPRRKLEDNNKMNLKQI
jgi:hypothetical protein